MNYCTTASAIISYNDIVPTPELPAEGEWKLVATTFMMTNIHPSTGMVTGRMIWTWQLSCCDGIGYCRTHNPFGPVG